MISIFGKLYTLLRRPQATEPKAESPDYGEGACKSKDEHSGGNGDAPADTQSASCGEKEQIQPSVNSGDEKSSSGEDQAPQDKPPEQIVEVEKIVPAVQKIMTESTASGEWEHIQTTDGSPTAVKSDSKKCVEAGAGILKVMTDSTASSGWEHIHNDDAPEKKEEITKDEVCESHLSAEDLVTKLASENEGTDVDKAGNAVQETVCTSGEENKAALDKEADQKHDNNVEKSVDTKATADGEKSKERKSKKKICTYYKRGLDCWKGKKCPFVHERKEKHHESCDTEVEPVAREQKTILEKDYSNYHEFVSDMTLHSKLINAKDLFYKLGYEKDVNKDQVATAVIGQYKLAKSRPNMAWVKDARYFAELFFVPQWIDENMPLGDHKPRNRNRKQKQKHNFNEHFENPGGLCKDFRLIDNPNLEKVVTNAAGDGTIEKVNNGDTQQACNGAGDAVSIKLPGDTATSNLAASADQFVTDYTEQVIQEAMKMAISDGLSESAIMEVIDDVAISATSKTATPHKRVQPAVVDLSRTPRRRPDQLAMGFNYHSDVVVKESPKTVYGGIIPLDNMPTPREKTEQLAVGFSYHAEQLVKDSPRTETGDILIPGIVTTPRRRTRDQLAIGFNYHSEVIAKDSSFSLVNDSGKGENISKEGSEQNDIDNERSSEINGNNDLNNKSKEIENEPNIKSGKKLFKDTFAVGFSYNSDQMVKESLVEINGNIPNEESVSELIEDASLGEGRNNLENLVEAVKEDGIGTVDGLPAGSVW